MAGKESNCCYKRRKIQRAINAYERFVEQMRKAGSFYNAPVPRLGIMMDSGKIRMDTMILDKSDYLINCNLRLDRTKKVFLHTSKPESAEYMTDSEHNSTLEEYKRNILQEGDEVLLLKLDRHEKYILIAKVVVPE